MSSVERYLLRLLRSRTAGILGTLFAAIAFGLLFREAIGSDASLPLTGSPLPLALALAAFLAFQAAAATLLSLLGAHPAPRLWALAQVIKYLPTPGSALAGLMTGAVRSGYDFRRSLGFVTRHSGLLAGTAVVSGAPAFAALGRHQLGVPQTLGTLVCLAVGLVLAQISVRVLPARKQLAAIIGGTVVWFLLGLVLWATAGRLQGGALIVASSFPAAWVVGLLALPVPAGLGVREGVLLLLLERQVGSDAALAYGIVTRLLHVASDGLFALAVFGAQRFLPTVPKYLRSRT